MHVLGVARTDGRVMREATALARAGTDVWIVDIEQDRRRPHVEEVDGIRIKHIKMPSWFVPVRFRPAFLVKMVRALASGTLALLSIPAEVYHAHEDRALPACYLAARLRGKRLVFDAHELPLAEPGVNRWRPLRIMRARLLRWMMPACAGIITVSPPIVHELRRRFGGRRAILLRNVLAYQAPVSSDRLKSHLGLGIETRVALYQGNLQEDRGLDGLVRAARSLEPGVVIVMMGAGPAQAELDALVAQLGVGDRVKIIPPVPYRELLAWTASADVGLIIYPQGYSLNVQMCLPNKLFEYLMAGVPVLASPLEAVAELIAAYDVGAVVTVLEPREVARAICDLVGDQTRQARMRANALEACQRDLRWDIESQRLIRLYEQILGICLADTAAKEHSPMEVREQLST